MVQKRRSEAKGNTRNGPETTQTTGAQYGDYRSLRSGQIARKLYHEILVCRYRIERSLGKHASQSGIRVADGTGVQL